MKSRSDELFTPAMKRAAIVSDCGRFRYHLRREWTNGSTLLFVMLNPSTADADVDDNTIRRCIGFGQAEGFGAIEVVNLFAYRATDPADLRRAGYPVGPDNDFHLRMAAALARRVCVAWGAASQDAVDARVQVVLPLLRQTLGRDPDCLHVTRTGYPGHPLYLPKASRLRPFDMAAVEAAMDGGQAAK
jgi:hypothetical protein